MRCENVSLLVAEFPIALCTHECVDGTNMVLPVRKGGPHQSSPRRCKSMKLLFKVVLSCNLSTCRPKHSKLKK